MVTRPVLRYHGGKFRLREWVISHFPPHKTYVEAFGGAASVLLAKPRVYKEVYNDLDGSIVSLFRILRDAESASRLIEILELTPFSRKEFNDCFEPSDDPIESARRMIVRGMQGVGAKGLGERTGWRTSTPASGNIASGWRTYPDGLRQIVERLHGVHIENVSALRTLALYDSPDTLFYLDPPYVHSTRAKGHRKIYNFEMADSEHQELLSAIRQVQGRVVLSGYDHPIYNEALEGWEKKTINTRAQTNVARVECLWIKPSSQPSLELIKETA